MAKAPLKIPFDKDGNLQGYATNFNFGEWRDNYEFEGILILDRTARGRSAAHFIFYDELGRRYQMFMTDMLDMVKRAPTIAYGHVEGTWTFCKRGSNYGVKFVR